MKMKAVSCIMVLVTSCYASDSNAGIHSSALGIEEEQHQPVEVTFDIQNEVNIIHSL